MFLHSMGTPETVHELQVHMGISILVTSINTMVNNLSKEANIRMKEEGQKFVTSFVYDNIDIDLKSATPTIERAQDTLLHLTSVTMLLLHHGITTTDLDCTEAV